MPPTPFRPDVPDRCFPSPLMQARPRRRGVTLVELMVGLTLAGVLAAIAYPAYQAQIAKGRVTQAVNEIGELSIQLERYFTEKGKFPPSLAAAGLARNDPWGNAYEYLNMDGAKVGQVRKDKSLHPLNTDYDLYSKGADGKSASPLTAKISHDDIIRGNNGGYIGLAEKY